MLAPNGGVAQLVRALACHARGRGFESRHSRHHFKSINIATTKVVNRIDRPASSFHSIGMKQAITATYLFLKALLKSLNAWLLPFVQKSSRASLSLLRSSASKWPFAHLKMRAAIRLFFIISALIIPSLTAQAENIHKIERHCTKPVKIEFQKVFMQDALVRNANREAESLWRKKVIERDGSLYAEFQAALERRSNCLRIGFGNDPQGNVGTFIACQVSGRPCTYLVRR